MTLFTKFGKEEEGKKIVDLESAGYEKLLGGGKHFQCLFRKSRTILQHLLKRN